jgi:hypothetical protein
VLLEKILKELRKTNLYLAEMSGAHITDEDIY